MRVRVGVRVRVRERAFFLTSNMVLETVHSTFEHVQIKIGHKTKTKTRAR